MTNKTAFAPDEFHQIAFEEGRPADNGDGYLFTAEEFDLFVQRLLDSNSLADPVPPAGGCDLPKRLDPNSQPGYGHFPHLEGWNDACDAWEPHVTRLQAEVKRLIAQKADTDIPASPADKGQGEPVACAVFNDPLYNAESDARNASALLEEVIAWFDDGVGRSPAEFKLMRKIGDWLGRSVPRIDGSSDECDHSEANKIGCPECGEVFK